MKAGEEVLKILKLAVFYTQFHLYSKLLLSQTFHFPLIDFPKHPFATQPNLSSSLLSMVNSNHNSARRHRDEPPESRRSLRRKLNEEDRSPVDLHQELISQIRAQLEILDSSFSSAEESRESAQTALSVLAELAKNGTEMEN